MGEVFFLAMGLGLVFNAAPGAVFAESLRRGLGGGFRPALAVQVGSLLGDAVWAALGLAGVGALFTLPALRVPLTAAGCLVLAWLGVRGLRDATTRRGARARPDTAEARSAGALSAGAGMSLGNPLNVVYWSGTAGVVGGALGREAAFADLAVFFAGFMASSLAWCFLCAAGIALLRRALSETAARVVEALCGAALLALAALAPLRLVSG